MYKRQGINIAPTFGGINLEDISAPKCFEIEEKLQEALDIPVFHDDQHGTATVSYTHLDVYKRQEQSASSHYSATHLLRY